MRIGVISMRPERLLWYGASFPGHVFVYLAPESIQSGLCCCENFIVDADMLTDDHTSYEGLTRYLNRPVIDQMADAYRKQQAKHNNSRSPPVSPSCEQCGSQGRGGCLDSSITKFYRIIYRERNNS